MTPFCIFDNKSKMNQTVYGVALKMICAATLTNAALAAQLPPPTLVRAESTETTSFGTLLCNRAVLYWTNPSQVKVSHYRIYINGRDANDDITFLANGNIGVTLYDDATQTIQLASVDSTGEVGPLSNALTVTTPRCVSPKEYKIAILMATFADFQGIPMPDNQPWTLDVVKNGYGVFTNGLNKSYTIADWLQRAAYGKVKVNIDFFDEVILKKNMMEYCSFTLPNYGTVLGYGCNTLQINQDAIDANGGQSKFSGYQSVAVLVKGLGTVGISGITLSAHAAHHSTYHPNDTPPFAPLVHEFYHGLNLTHHAAFRALEGCYYPKDLSDITKNCTWDRYGGSSIMGAGIDLSPNADELRRLGLLKKNQIVKITPQTGTTSVALEPLSLKSFGVKQIQIQGTGHFWFPNTYVFLEYRRPTGINHRTGMKEAIFIHLRADKQNNGNRDALTYELKDKLTPDSPVLSLPEWGISLSLQQMTAKQAVVVVNYI